MLHVQFLIKISFLIKEPFQTGYTSEYFISEKTFCAKREKATRRRFFLTRTMKIKEKINFQNFFRFGRLKLSLYSSIKAVNISH